MLRNSSWMPYAPQGVKGFDDDDDDDDETLRRNLKETSKSTSFKGNYLIRSKTVKNENSLLFINTEVYK